MTEVMFDAGKMLDDLWKDITMALETKLGEGQLEGSRWNFETDICGSISTRSLRKMGVTMREIA